MGRARRLLAALCVAGVLAIPAHSRAQDAPAGNADNGKKIFLADGCYECHGRDGQGGAFNGPAPILAQTALPFDAFKQQLRDPSNEMPPYVDAVLDDQGAADIFAFLHTLKGPIPAKDVPLLNH
jgi:mono/diheme cytochrome c family protein